MSTKVGIDIGITDRFKEQATPDVLLVVTRQALDSILRSVVQELSPGSEIIGAAPDETLQPCPKEKGTCVDDPHKHFIFNKEIVSAEEFAQILEGAE